MCRVVLILFLVSWTTAAWAWVPLFSPSFRSLPSHQGTSRDDGDFYEMSRRSVLGVSFAAVSLTFRPSASFPKDRSSAPTAWPHSPSPLPTSARTPVELSSLTLSYEENDPLASFGIELSGMKKVNTNISVNATGLNQAIDQSIKKKQIDPRTHG